MSKPVDIGSLKVGQHIIIDEEPCKIVEYEKSKPGKHGSAKARIVGIGVFSNQKRNIISPVGAKVNMPIIDKRTAQVISITKDTMQLMDMESYQTFESILPDEPELKEKIIAGIEVEYWSILGRNKIVRVK